jgi:hypothetical protein
MVLSSLWRRQARRIEYEKLLKTFAAVGRMIVKRAEWCSGHSGPTTGRYLHVT